MAIIKVDTTEESKPEIRCVEPKTDPEPECKSEETAAGERSTGLKINRNDAPHAGSIYIISESATSRVITNDNGRAILTSLSGGVPSKSQKWVCQRSGSWFGFTNDSGIETTYLGHDVRGILICTANSHSQWEHFVVTKREGDGFDVMLRHWFGIQPLGFRNDGTDLGKRDVADTWWGFTKVG